MKKTDLAMECSYPGKLTNLDIRTNYRNLEFYVSLSQIQGAFSFWVVAQNPNKDLIDIRPSLIEFTEYIASFFESPNLPEKFTYNELSGILTEARLENIPEILKLNKLKPDFIDLGALARNVFYMIVREHITSSH